jgi:hypothetical protein
MEQLFTSTNLLYMDVPDISSNNFSSSNYHKNQYTYSNRLILNNKSGRFQFMDSSGDTMYGIYIGKFILDDPANKLTLYYENFVNPYPLVDEDPYKKFSEISTLQFEIIEKKNNKKNFLGEFVTEYTIIFSKSPITFDSNEINIDYPKTFIVM